MNTLPIELTAAAFGVAGTILLGVWVWLIKPRAAAMPKHNETKP